MSNLPKHCANFLPPEDPFMSNLCCHITSNLYQFLPIYTNFATKFFLYIGWILFVHRLDTVQKQAAEMVPKVVPP